MTNKTDSAKPFDLDEWVESGLPRDGNDSWSYGQKAGRAEGYALGRSQLASEILAAARDELKKIANEMSAEQRGVFDTGYFEGMRHFLYLIEQRLKEVG